MAVPSISAPIPPLPPATPPGLIQSVLSSSDATAWINITLASATLVVTGVGVVVAISAVVGYQSARRMIKRQAQKLAQERTDEYLKSEQFEGQMQKAVTSLMKDHIKDRFVNALFQSTQPSERQQAGPQELKGDSDV